MAITSIASRVASARDVSLKRIESTEQANGRTLTVGALQSVARCHVFELHKHPKHRRHLNRSLPNTAVTRVTLQVQPKKTGKTLAASLQPNEFYGAARWSRILAGLLGDPVPPVGSPGMESDGAKDVFEVVAFGAAGSNIYGRYRGEEPV